MSFCSQKYIFYWMGDLPLVVRGTVLSSVIRMAGNGTINRNAVFVEVFWCEIRPIFPFYGIE